MDQGTWLLWPDLESAISPRILTFRIILSLHLFALVASAADTTDLTANSARQVQTPDLTPVTFLAPATHPPVMLVQEGRPVAVVYVADPSPAPSLAILINELIEDIRLTPGAVLEVIKTPPPAERIAIVIGDCEESRAAGIDAAGIPVEGFVVKTAPNRVFLVGSTQPLPITDTRRAGRGCANEGTAWAVADFLERTVRVRWYWPVAAGGRSIVRQATLNVLPTLYRDQPVFRRREFSNTQGYRPSSWKANRKAGAPLLPDTLLAPGTKEIETQPMLAGLRAGCSLPYIIQVHEPQKFSPQVRSEHQDMFQLRADGTRSPAMLCYSSPDALLYLLKGCEEVWDHGKRASWVTPTCVSVSPGDEPVLCHCEACSALRDAARGTYGTGSRVMGLFVQKMCREVKKRWPDKKVLYLPYWNYTECEESVGYPGNLEVQMCTMAFGIMRQPAARQQIEKNLRAWSRKVGGPITTWEYSHRVPEWTCAPVQYPHLVQDYYRSNRDILQGSFLNGRWIGEWSVSAPTDYCWFKVLWNPDVNIDAILDELCIRMFGKGASPARELMRLACDRWEKAPWLSGLGDAGKISAAVYTDTWPPEVVARMSELRDQARREMAGDPQAEQRFGYWTWTFDDFLKEAKEAWAQAAAPGATTERPEK
jgi:hypothetical protein